MTQTIEASGAPTGEAAARVRAADIIAEAMRQEGVTFVAGVTGGSTFEMFDAISKIPDVRILVTRHERNAVDIADGYARVSGRPGVAMCVQGPGGANAFGGIANSFADSVPVLLMQGMVRQQNVDRGASQDTDMLFAFSQVVRWRVELTTAERTPEIMRRAFSRLTATRPGPVVVGVPANVAASTVPAEQGRYTPIRQPRLHFRPATEETDRAAQLLAGATFPLLYAGAGVLWAEASAELRELAELLGAPVMTTLVGKSAIDERHPLSLGLGGFPTSQYTHKAAEQLFPKADVVLAIGASFKQQATLYRPVPSQPKLIQIDADPAEFNKHYPAEVALLGDARSALRDLIAAVRQYVPRHRDASVLQAEIQHWRAEQATFWQPYVTSDQAPVSPHRTITELMRAVNPDDAIVLHDSGSSRGFVGHHWVATQPRGVLAFGGQSSMGWSNGAAIGAKLAAPEKTVINVIGDGAFGMTGMELSTAAPYGIKIITIVLNNGGFDATRGAATSALKARPVNWDWFSQQGDYATVAKGLGAEGLRVERPEELQGAFQRALAAEGPVLIDVQSQFMAQDATVTMGNRFEL
ncbi:MAG: thiamine pyrophosphate-binding protein [Chloroflexi bacterium]|nr:thiamine pyrophosphate-binding protein [Chloroflexota bacterium]